MTFKFILLYGPPNSTMYINHIFSILISLIYSSTVRIHNWFTLLEQITFPLDFISGGGSHQQFSRSWCQITCSRQNLSELCSLCLSPSQAAEPTVRLLWPADLILELFQYLLSRTRNTVGYKICTLMSNKQRHMGLTHCDLIHPSEHLLHVSVDSPYWILGFESWIQGNIIEISKVSSWDICFEPTQGSLAKTLLRLRMKMPK